MVEDQADFETSRTVVAASVVCHADARAGGRRLRLVYVFGGTGANPLGRSQTDRRHSDVVCAGVQTRLCFPLRMCTGTVPRVLSSLPQVLSRGSMRPFSVSSLRSPIRVR